MNEPYQAEVEAFLAQTHIAVLGYSHDAQMPANAIYDRLSASGYQVFAVNSNADGFTNVDVWPTIASLPPEVTAAVLCTPPQATDQALNALAAKGIRHAWIHHGIGQGSYTETAEDTARTAGLRLVPDGCPLMFVEPDFFHRCLKGCLSLFGRMKATEIPTQ